MAARNIDAYLSGGVTNTDPNASLGGGASAEKLYGQNPAYDAATISGVTLVDSANLSSVELSFTFAGTVLSIRKTTDVLPVIEVTVSVDGEYVLVSPDNSVELTVLVTNASLPVSSSMETITATNINHNLFDQVSSNNSKVGDINYRHFYIKNNLASDLSLKIIIEKQLNGLDYIEIGFENTTGGTQDTLIQDENTQPAGVSFSSPSDVLNATLLTVPAFAYIGVFIKRTVLALTDISTPNDTAILNIVEYQ